MGLLDMNVVSDYGNYIYVCRHDEHVLAPQPRTALIMYLNYAEQSSDHTRFVHEITHTNRLTHGTLCPRY